jgi:hypothetical protein
MSDIDGKAARVAETGAGAEVIKIASRAQLHRRQLKSFRRAHAIIVFGLRATAQAWPVSGPLALPVISLRISSEISNDTCSEADFF